jgi:hypothetical protein
MAGGGAHAVRERGGGVFKVLSPFVGGGAGEFVVYTLGPRQSGPSTDRAPGAVAGGGSVRREGEVSAALDVPGVTGDLTYP